MEYPELKKLYYKDKENYDKQCALRPESLSAMLLPLEIHHCQSYYMNCPQITKLLSDIYAGAFKLQKSIDQLPGIAYDCYARNCLIDEVMMTNDLEGVHSTKKEIRDILDTDKKQGKKDDRLRGMVMKYAKLLYSGKEKVSLKNSRDIRALYDEIVLGEIAEEDRPDGEIFRKGQVSVVTATDKEKHKGINPPESKIVESVDQALGILENPDIPPLIGIAVLHYYIGYIHPFYDGNGRLSRFISSYLLRQNLGTLVGIRLAYTIKNEKKLYYSAFDSANDRKNKGDITPFVIIFLKIVSDAITELREKIKNGAEAYGYYQYLLKCLSINLDKDMMSVLFILIQNELFGSEAMDITELSEAMELSTGKIRTRLSGMMDRGLKDVIKMGRKGHKFVYSVDLDALEAICSDKTE